MRMGPGADQCAEEQKGIASRCFFRRFWCKNYLRLRLQAMGRAPADGDLAAHLRRAQQPISYQPDTV